MTFFHPANDQTFDAPLSRRALLHRLGGWAGAALGGGALNRLGLSAARAAVPEPLPAMTGPARPELAPLDRLMIDFMKDHRVPGAALAVTRAGRLVYARGFGLADRERGEKVAPDSLFRIASVSKPITAVAVLQLVEQKKLELTARVCEVLRLPEPADARWKRVTVLDLLRHTGGWDRTKSFDPMFRSVEIAKTLGARPPAGPDEVIRYMLRQPLDFDPGSRFAYSNFGYCLLGRVIERVAGVRYEAHVRDRVLRPLGIERMRIARSLAADRAAGEVTYYDARNRSEPAVLGEVGRPAPAPYGAFYLEAMDSHGAWIASAIDLVRFASAFDVPSRCKVLRAETIATMFGRPEGPAGRDPAGTPKAVYYACGWNVRPAGGPGRANTWHGGNIPGASSLLVRRHDGLDWAVLFNTDAGPHGKDLGHAIDPLVHQAVDQVKTWPDIDWFPRFQIDSRKRSMPR
jgi:N-acyl-D-amino-acid deacylase